MYRRYNQWISVKKLRERVKLNEERKKKYDEELRKVETAQVERKTQFRMKGLLVIVKESYNQPMFNVRCNTFN